jgi:hypothetical protein
MLGVPTSSNLREELLPSCATSKKVLVAYQKGDAPPVGGGTQALHTATYQWCSIFWVRYKYMISGAVPRKWYATSSPPVVGGTTGNPGTTYWWRTTSLVLHQ